MLNNTVKIVRGSHIYGSAHKGSDIDMLWIVPDLNEFAKKENKVIESDGFIHFIDDTTFDTIYDIQVISYDQFVELINKYDIMAIEALYSAHPCDENHSDIDHLKYSTIDTWKLRQSISAVCNNSWAKFHKKLTVEKDFDLYIGLKSLFHVLRMYRYGIQLAKYGKIIDFKCNDSGVSIDKWNLKTQYDYIMSMGDPKSGLSYENIKESIQPLRNFYASELKKYCPKPKIK